MKIFVLLILFLVANNIEYIKNDEVLPGPVAVAMIHDSPQVNDRFHKMGHEHAQKFLETVFHPNPIVERQVWPGIYTANCMGVHFQDTTSFNKAHKPGFQRGLLLAHRQIWEDFARKHHSIPENISYFESPKLVIFEDDAMEIDPIVHDIAFQSVQNMTKDLHLLGLCYDRDPGKKVPECTHAYALTVRGCRKLFANIDQCCRTGQLDKQFQLLGKEGLITWSNVPASTPYNITDKYIQNNSGTHCHSPTYSLI